MESREVIQLDTVFGSLKPDTTWKAIRAQSGPFTARQLLDAAYGPQTTRPMQSIPCRCGRRTVIAPDGTETTCDRCRVELAPSYSLTYGEFNDEDTWQVSESGRPAFEWFAGHWWKLDGRTSERTSHRVKNAEKIAQLDRESGRLKQKKNAKPEEPKQKLASYVEWEDGSRLPFGVTPCWCPPGARHMSPNAHAEKCPSHLDECSTCGETWDR